MSGLPPDATARLTEIATAYRAAFDDVQARLGTLEVGKIPRWVFGIDPFDIIELAALDRDLARAEQRRRQWRAALHAMAELAALQGESGVLPSGAENTLDPDALEDDGELATLAEAADPDGLPALDRFISVVQYARSSGCMYVDGGFAPVVKGRRR